MYYHEFRAMNTAILLGAEGDLRRVREGFAEVEDLVYSLERRFTRFSEDSELSALNRASGEWFEASGHMIEVVQLALNYYSRTGGLFNPGVLAALETAGYDRSMELVRAGREDGSAAVAVLTKEPETLSVPDFARTQIDPLHQAICLPKELRIDLGGIAKGWIAEQAARQLSRCAAACVVDAGGDLFAVGLPADGRWRVGLEDPFAPADDLAVLTVGPGAVATSSLMKRRWVRGGQEYHHLIDPRTSLPTHSMWVSVTVVTDHTAWAEALAKSLLIGGPDGANQLVRFNRGEAFIAVDQNGKMWASPNSDRILQEHLEQTTVKPYRMSLFPKSKPKYGEWRGW